MGDFLEFMIIFKNRKREKKNAMLVNVILEFLFENKKLKTFRKFYKRKTHEFKKKIGFDLDLLIKFFIHS